jgi:hypothetical protein
MAMLKIACHFVLENGPGSRGFLPIVKGAIQTFDGYEREEGERDEGRDIHKANKCIAQDVSPNVSAPTTTSSPFIHSLSSPLIF